ncbi:MAG: carboxypeptidase-like regulatory domain-containing protein, partial [Gemmatimonadota bacterium]
MPPQVLASFGSLTRRAAAPIVAVAALAVAACDGRPSDDGSAAASGPAVPESAGHIGGVVTGPDGPEAGVWVIAETHDLPTRFARIVVTNDEGRYLIPDLPDAEYDVWVRGYGLVDSEKVRAAPGETLDLAAVPAPDEAAAARYYPAGWWLALLEVPGADEFPGTGPESEGGNGLSPNLETQAEFLRNVKSGNCMACHQLGSLGTREIPESIRDEHESGVDAWERRLRSGQAGGSMIGSVERMGRDRVLAMFADWTDRIAAGEVPPEAPPRPEGVERTVVITQWEWADPHAYLHDLVSTDRRDPTVNAYGPLYGVLELSADYLPVLDPLTHTAERIPLEPRDPETPVAPNQDMPAPSPYWGDEILWDSRVNAHNPMLDGRDRVWLTAAVAPPETPDFCREDSDHPSAVVLPIERSSRHLAVYDPETEELAHVRTCFSTHHLMFAQDESNTLWTSGHPSAFGWLDTRTFDETGDEAASQGWTPLVLDANGNGERDEYTGPDETADPALDRRITPGYVYGIAPAPDGSVWASILSFPGGVVRLVPGGDPPETALAEWYEVPWDNPDAPTVGYGPRGM